MGNNFIHMVVGGIPEEIVVRMVALGGCRGHRMELEKSKYNCGSVTIFEPWAFSQVVLEMLTEAGVDVCLHTFFSMPWMENESICGAFLETKEGRMVISAKVTVDCSGDGDVAARAGAKIFKGNENTGQIQSATVLFTLENVDIASFFEARRKNPELYRTHTPVPSCDGMAEYEAGQLCEMTGLEPLMVPLHAKGKLGFPQPYMLLVALLPKGKFLVNMAKVENLDPTCADSLTRGELHARMRIRKVVDFLHQHVPGFSEARVCSISHQIGIRESRHLVGKHILTIEEMRERKTYKDSIAMGSYYTDIHRPEPEMEAEARFIPETVTFPNGYFIPYRCLLPQEVGHLLVAGRCMSATQEANGSTRIMPQCMAMGQAAGIAAALSAKQGISPADLDIRILQDALREMGGIF